MNKKNILSPYVINHETLKKSPNVYDSHKSVAMHYMSWAKRIANHNIISHYYFSNLLRGYIPNNKINTVLDIGAGNGNFPSIFYNDWSPIRLIMIDLPETLTTAFTFLSSLFPNANIILPNEIEEKIPNDFDFILMTPEQIEIIDDNSIDLAVNIHSFQEMTHQQINIYFKLIQRVVRLSGYFFSSNRIEKVPSGADSFTIEQTILPNRFFEYPWNHKNKILINEVSSFQRLVQADASGIRLEEIH
jgi:putative sugar O-methyltransferase